MNIKLKFTIAMVVEHFFIIPTVEQVNYIFLQWLSD